MVLKKLLTIPVDVFVNLRDDLAGSNERRPSFLRSLAKFPGDFRRRPQLPSRFLDQVFRGVPDLFVDLGPIRHRPANVSVQELYCLHVLARMAAPDLIFEFGTFDGQTALQLASACPTATVHTLDLPPASESDLQRDAFSREVGRLGVGSRFMEREEGRRIRQLYGDSLALDVRPYEGKVGFVFIDACHEYEYVRSDTAKAYAMVRNGIIAWHDYRREWPGVIRALDELGPRPRMSHIAGTSLAFDIVGDLSAAEVCLPA